MAVQVAANKSSFRESAVKAHVVKYSSADKDQCSVTTPKFQKAESDSIELERTPQ